MKGFIKFIAVVSAVLAVVFAAAACSDFKKGVLPDYVFTNAVDGGDWRDIEYTDKSVAVDGRLDESAWDLSAPYEYEDVDFGVKLSVKTLFADDGMFLAMRVYTKTAYYNEEREVRNNTGAEFYIAPYGTLKRCDDVIQVRTDISGAVYTYRGVTAGSPVGDSWLQKYVPAMAKVSIEGEINSNDVEHIDFELFIPWQSLNLADKPDAVSMFPAFNHLMGAGYREQRTWISPLSNTSDIASYIKMTESGSAIRPNGLLGHNPVGQNMTDGWALDAEAGTARTTEAGQRRVYVQGDPAEKYVMSAVVSARSTLGGDKAPKVGIILGENSESGTLISVFDTRTPYSPARDLYTVLKPIGSGNWDWPAADNEGLVSVNGLIIPDEKTKLTVVRDGVSFYIFVNDVFAYSRSVAGFTGGAIPGLISMGCEAEFSTVTYSCDSALSDAFIKKIKYETDSWRVVGNLSVDTDSVTILPGQKHVAGELKTGRQQALYLSEALDGNFALEFKLDGFDFPLTYGAPRVDIFLDSPDGSNNHRIGIYLKNNCVKTLLGSDSEDHGYGMPDYSGSNDVKIIREVISGGSVFRIWFNGVKIGESECAYIGDYNLAFGASYACGVIGDVAVRQARTYLVEVNVPENGEALLDKDAATEGSGVNVTLAPAEGFRVAEFTVNGRDCIGEIVSGAFAVSDISENLQIYVRFEKIPAARVNVSGSVALDQPALGDIGDVAVKAVSQAENDVTFTVDENGKYNVDLLADETYTLIFTLNRFIAAHINIETGSVDISGKNIMLVFDRKAIIDGKLDGDELMYDDNHKVSFDSGDFEATVHSYLGDDGVYVRAYVKDTDLTKIGENPVTESDQLELVFVRPDRVAPMRLSGQGLKLVFTPDGRVYCNEIADNGYLAGELWPDGKIEKAVNLDGTYNDSSDTDTGWALEFMLPYSELGLESKPESLRIGIIKRNVGSTGTAGRKSFGGADEVKPLTFSRLGSDSLGISTAESADGRFVVDGSLDEWNMDAGCKALEFEGVRGMTAYMVKGADGLYIALKAVFDNFNSGHATWNSNTCFDINVSWNGINCRMDFLFTSENTFEARKGTNNILCEVAHLLDRAELDGRQRYVLTAEIFVPCGTYYEMRGMAAFTTSDSSAVKESIILLKSDGSKGSSTTNWRFDGLNTGTVSNQWHIREDSYSAN